MNLLRVILFLIVIFAASCSESLKNKGIMVTGKIQNAEGVKVIFRELDADASHTIDSIVLDKIGLFRFMYNSSEEGFYILKLESGEQIILQTGNGEEVFVEADLETVPFSYVVKGSPGSEILREFFIQTRKNTDRADSLRSVLLQNRESPDFYQLSLSFDTLFTKIIENQKHLQERFIKLYPEKLASLLILNYKFGLVPVLSLKDDFPLYQSLDSNLMKNYPANKHVLFHHNRIIEHQQHNER